MMETTTTFHQIFSPRFKLCFSLTIWRYPGLFSTLRFMHASNKFPPSVPISLLFGRLCEIGTRLRDFGHRSSDFAGPQCKSVFSLLPLSRISNSNRCRHSHRLPFRHHPLPSCFLSRLRNFGCRSGELCTCKFTVCPHATCTG